MYEVTERELILPPDILDLANKSNILDIEGTDLVDQMRKRILQILTEQQKLTGPVKILSARKKESHFDASGNIYGTQIQYIDPLSLLSSYTEQRELAEEKNHSGTPIKLPSLALDLAQPTAT